MATKKLHNDDPFYEVVKSAEVQILQGHLVFQKWTCRFCNERVTMGQPNQFYKNGVHEGCAVNPTGETDLVERGCNYLMIQASSKKGQDKLRDLGNL